MPYDFANAAEIIRLSSTCVPESVEDQLRTLLTSKPRKLHMALSYDEIGGKLYEKLCRQPEYYLARTEKNLLYRESGRIIALSRPTQVVDLGSGNFEKSQILLHEAIKQNKYIEYMPCDIDENVISNSIRHLSHFYGKNVTIRAIVGSFENCINYLTPFNGERLFTFTGNTYSNLTKSERQQLLSCLSQCMTELDSFLLGVDLVKSPEILETAYNDAEGSVRDAMLQMLVVLNKNYGANFVVNAFEHVCKFQPEQRAVISYLVSKRDQQVDIKGLNLCVNLQTGEWIEAEMREKFVLHELLADLSQFGFMPIQVTVDKEKPYALLLLCKDLSHSAFAEQLAA